MSAPILTFYYHPDSGTQPSIDSEATQHKHYTIQKAALNTKQTWA